MRLREPMAPLKIYVDGEDSLGWSIDQDRQHIQKIASNIPMDITRHWWMADIVHNIWWNQLSNRKNNQSSRCSWICISLINRIKKTFKRDVCI